jgi:hypothetical protein
MTDARNLTLFLSFIVVAVCVIAAMVVLGKRKKRIASTDMGRASLSRQPKRPDRSGQGDALRQNLRLKVTYDEAKVDRLIEFERSELRRKGLADEGAENLLQRAIALGTGKRPLVPTYSISANPLHSSRCALT